MTPRGIASSPDTPEHSRIWQIGQPLDLDWRKAIFASDLEAPGQPGLLFPVSTICTDESINGMDSFPSENRCRAYPSLSCKIGRKGGIEANLATTTTKRKLYKLFIFSC